MNTIRFVKWACNRCKQEYDLEIEEDEITTRMWCPICNRLMSRINDYKSERREIQ